MTFSKEKNKTKTNKKPTSKHLEQYLQTCSNNWKGSVFGSTGFCRERKFKFLTQFQERKKEKKIRFPNNQQNTGERENNAVFCSLGDNLNVIAAEIHYG